jgi:general secretion pathway protein D
MKWTGWTHVAGLLLVALLISPQYSSAQNKNSDKSIGSQTKSAPSTVSPGGIPFSQAQPEDITNENYGDLIESFDYPNADITELVKAISKLTGKRFILDNNVRGKITIIAPSQITVAEAYKAFLSALAMNGLTVVPSGKFLKIRQARQANRDSIDTYAGEYFPNTDQLITRIVKLRYINAAEVAKSLRMLVSKDGEINPYAPTNSLIITDYGSHIERAMGILRELDVPGFEEKLEVIPIVHAKAQDIATLIDQIINKEAKSKSGSRPRFQRRSSKKGDDAGGAESLSLTIADERTNSIIVVGNETGVNKIKDLVAKLDFKLRPEDEGGVYVYYVRHGEAEQMANVINGIASEAKKAQEEKERQTGRRGSTSTRSSTTSTDEDEGSTNAIFGGNVKVAADKVTNSLIITAGRQDYNVVKGLLAKIDIPRDQVFVKSIIMEMNAEKRTEWGVNYYKFDGDSNGIGRAGFRTGNITDLVNPANDSGLILGFGAGDTVNVEISGEEFTVTSLVGLVKFLKANVGGNVLSTPQLTALDNEEAEIEVGQTIPVGASSQTTGSTVSNSIQREKATIKLKVKPFISPDSDTVRMNIEQTIKQLSRRKVEQSQLAEAAVVTNDRSIKTTIVMNSGDTAVLGGLMTDQEEEEVSKVPILGDIPILGWLFKSKKISKTKTNLLVFLTPKIIRNAEDNADLLNTKLNERIDFIQKNLNGRDPHGLEIDKLPRKVLNQEDGADEPQQEEPAIETF